MPARNHPGLHCTMDDALNAFGCMIDIQFILDPASARSYISKYISKPEKTSARTQNMLKAVVATGAGKGARMEAVMQQCMHALTISRDYGRWETALIASGLELSHVSKPLKKVNLKGSCTVVADSSGDEADPFEVEKEEQADEGNAKAQTLHSYVSAYGMRAAKFAEISLYEWAAYHDSKGGKFDSAQVPWVVPNYELVFVEEDKEPSKEQEAVEHWAERKLMVHVPWRGKDWKAVKEVGGVVHETYRGALQSMLPSWVNELADALTSGTAPLPVWPREWTSDLPPVVVRQWARALLRRGYTQVEVPWPDNDEEDTSTGL